MSWSPRSDGLDLERDLPVSAEDREALRRHGRAPHGPLLERVDLLSWPSWLPTPRNRRATHDGFEPFEL